MPTIHILGKLLPSVNLLSFDGIPAVDHTASDIGLEMHFVINVLKSQVDITIELNKWEPSYFDWIYVTAYHLCRTCIDIFHFATGEGFSLHLEKIVTPDGKTSLITHSNPSLATACTFVKFPTTNIEERLAFQRTLMAVFTEPPLFMALHDLMQSSMVPSEGITNCARVLDGLRKIVSPGLEPKLGWPVFHAIVNTDEAYLSLIFNHAKQTRHGDRSYVSGLITTEILHRTHHVMNRFIEYRLRGNQPLSLTEFPLLTQ